MLPNSSILYHNASNSVVLLDIPASITLAQEAENGSPVRILSSCSPLLQPYSSNEPKSEAARERLLQTNQADPRIDSAIHALAAGALAQIKADHQGKWCLDRHVGSEQGLSQLHDGASGGHHKERPNSNSKHAADLLLNIYPERGCSIIAPPPLILSSSANYISSWKEIYSSVVRNTSSRSTTFHVGMQVFFVPPSSCFLLSPLEHSQSNFTHMAQKLLPATLSHNAGEFDFILLDPPWPNRSVRRSETYKTAEHQLTDPWTYLSSFLGNHLAATGLIGVWVSNKPSVRSQVLQTFREWSLTLVEVWVWVKTTIDGEPVLPLDGLWRKPYEVLLLGRRSPNANIPNSNTNDEIQELLKAQKRMISAVPDLHSRKPCLKELIEASFFNHDDYRALEVFARNLTAGWWSWGDEVLKFNCDGYWGEISS